MIPQSSTRDGRSLATNWAEVTLHWVYKGDGVDGILIESHCLRRGANVSRFHQPRISPNSHGRTVFFQRSELEVGNQWGTRKEQGLN